MGVNYIPYTLDNPTVGDLIEFLSAYDKDRKLFLVMETQETDDDEFEIIIPPIEIYELEIEMEGIKDNGEPEDNHVIVCIR